MIIKKALKIKFIEFCINLLFDTIKKNISNLLNPGILIEGKEYLLIICDINYSYDCDHNEWVISMRKFRNAIVDDGYIHYESSYLDMFTVENHTKETMMADDVDYYFLNYWNLKTSNPKVVRASNFPSLVYISCEYD